MAALCLLLAGRSSVQAATSSRSVELLAEAGSEFPAPPGVDLEWSPLELRLLEAAQLGGDDRSWLLSAVFVASGERDEGRIAQQLRRIEELGQALSRKLQDTIEPQQRAAAALEFLHDELLVGGYQADATDLASALDGRGYNCVSSTVLFNCLAEDCGLNAEAVEMPGHVFSVVDSEAGSFDVETTCRNWFRSPELAATRRRSGARRRLSPAGLVALVYYNRGVDLLAKHRFAEAIIANLKALRFDPANEAARSNWLAGLNNWALELNERREFVGAVRLLRHGLQTAPAHRPFRINFVAVHQRWIEALLEREQYEPALEVLRRARGDLPEESYFEQAAANIQLRRAQASGSTNATANAAWSALLHARESQASAAE